MWGHKHRCKAAVYHHAPPSQKLYHIYIINSWIQVHISPLVVVNGGPALKYVKISSKQQLNGSLITCRNKLSRLVSQTQFFRSSGTGSRGFRSPHSNANMARGGGLSLGFLNFSFSFCKALRTSTGSVLPVNFCTPSSLNKDNKTETITPIEAEKRSQTYERRRKGLYSNSSIKVEGTVGLSSSSLACGCNSCQATMSYKGSMKHSGQHVIYLPVEFVVYLI